MDLVRLDAIPVPEGTGECRVFMVVRNEAARLLHFLEYHRRLGVHRFFVADNGSTDGTRDFLLRQADCHVFAAEGSFAAANYGMDWINRFIAEFGDGHWCLFLDADELFAYPGSERVPLPDFCRFLDGTGSEGVFAFMLDMYNRGPIAEATYQPGVPFLEVCDHFDRHYDFRRSQGLPFRPPPFPEIDVMGGARMRRFFPEFEGGARWRVALSKVLRVLRNGEVARNNGLGVLHGAARGIGIDRLEWVKRNSAPPPRLTKVPLIKGGIGVRYLTNHKTPPIRLSEVTGVLLHFKYFADFHARVVAESARGQHFDGSTEYARYAQALRENPRASLFDAEASEAWESTDRLVRLGLLRTTPAWEGFTARLSSGVPAGMGPGTGSPAPRTEARPSAPVLG